MSNVPLADAEELHFASPETFHLPTYWERASVKPGRVVKLIFEPNPDIPEERGERMWVRVESNNDGEYTGKLENTPLTLMGLDWGDGITFSAKHIIDIHHCEDVDV